MSKPKLAITIRSINTKSQDFIRLHDFFEISYLNKSGIRLSENEVITAINSADAVLAGTEPYNKAVLESTDSLKIISRVGVGLDNIDPATASQQGIIICNTPNAPTQAVAEHTLALIFALYKNIVRYNRNAQGYKQTVISGTLLSGKKAGIIGLGRIGFTVANLLAAFNCDINFYDPYVQDKKIPENWTRYSSVNELVQNSDIITLHMPPKSDNSPILDGECFDLFKSGSILINTARSSLVDERALLNALDHGIISGAGLDVYDNIIEDQIQNYPQIILTPHVASNTEESRYEMEAEAINNLIKAITEN